MRRIASAAPQPTRDEEFEAFVATSSLRLLRAARLLLDDRQRSEDLLQVTLMRTARHWRSARRAPEAYARRVLINASRDAHRSAAARVREEQLTDVAVIDDHADLVAERDELIVALARLPERQREVLVLRFYADLSVSETADAMGASEGTVKSYTSRALQRMRELLATPQPDTVEVPR